MSADRSWLERILDPDGTSRVRPLAVLAIAVVHLGLGTDAATLAREAAALDRAL